MANDASAHTTSMGAMQEGAAAAGSTTNNNASSHTSNKNLNTYTAPQVSASDYKTKKDVALDSLYPPTAQEVHGHIRYLSEEAMKLVMKEVDDCVGYCLRYSSNTKKCEMKGGNTVSDDSTMKRKDNPMTLATEIHNYFEMFQPDEEDNNEDSIASLKTEACMETTGTGTGSIQRQDILHDMLPKKYDPTLLPMITIKCYPNILDRIEMTKGLLLDLSKKDRSNSNPQTPLHHHQQKVADDKKSPCVCIVRSTSELVQQGHIMTEVLSQCISNDPNGEAFAMELQRQRKRQKSQHHGGVNKGVLVRSIWSWTQSLVEWAGFTEAFYSIVVILEDPEKIPSPILDSFFTTLTSLRSNDGVPISVIVIDATPGGLGDRLSKLRDPSLRGTTGVVARELFVPLPQIQLDIFVNHLYSGKCIPTFLWTNVRILNQIQELFQECDNSIVSVAKQLKMHLRRYFSLPGAFISLLNSDKFTIPNEYRMKWLFGDEHCRKIMLSHSSSATPSTKDYIFDLFWKMQISYLCHQICQRINVIFNLSPLGNTGQAAFEFHLSSRMHELLLLLGNVRDKVTTRKDASAASSDRSVSLCNKMSEFIILVGALAFEEDPSALNSSMAKALVENILAWASEQFSMQMTLEDASPVQPRREVAKALHLPTPYAAPIHGSLSHASQVAFQVFQSRVMTLADWHEKYFDVVADQDGHDGGVSSHESAFFFAVYELVHCGFVRKLLTGSRREDAYEKLAIIWGNGR